MKNTLLAALAAILALAPAIAEAQASLSSLTAATAANTINSGNNKQEWDWNSLTGGPAFYLHNSSTTATNGQVMLFVDSGGTNSTSNVGSITGQFINSHAGTSSTNTALVGLAQNGTTNNTGVIGETTGTNAGDVGIAGYVLGATGASYAVNGQNYSSTGYAGYFQALGGGYAAAFLGGNVGIGTATPKSLVHAYGGEIQVGSSGASCAAANGGAIRFSGSTLYYCDGSSTWQTISSSSSGTVSTGSAGQIAYYQSTGTTVIGTSTMNIVGGNVGIGTTLPTNLLSLSGSAAQTVWMERNPTSNTAGNNLTLQASGATTGATNKNGGTLTLASGISTGTGSSGIQFQTYNAGSSGTSDNSASTAMTITGGNVGIGTATPLTPGGSAADILQLTAQDYAQYISSVTDGTANNKVWRTIVRSTTSGSPVYQIQTLDDAGGNEVTGLQFTRSGYFITQVLFPNGNVGIQTASPSYTLQVNGSVAGTSAYVNTSDIRHKRNIHPLDVGLKEVAQLRPVTFEWKDDTLNHSIDGKVILRPLEPAMQGKQMGFIAQDVENVLPSVVITGTDAEKTKGMKYSELIPVLVKAIQEQQAQLTKDEASLAKDDATIAAMKAKLGM
jgi:hypothetical protein